PLARQLGRRRFRRPEELWPLGTPAGRIGDVVESAWRADTDAPIPTIAVLLVLAALLECSLCPSGGCARRRALRSRARAHTEGGPVSRCTPPDRLQPGLRAQVQGLGACLSSRAEAARPSGVDRFGRRSPSRL